MGRRARDRQRSNRDLLPFILGLVFFGLIAGGIFNLYRSVFLEQVPELDPPKAQVQSADKGDEAGEETPASEETGTRAKVEIPELQPEQKEVLVEGTVATLDYQNRTLTINQELDDNSTEINGTIQIGEQAIIRLNGATVKLVELAEGDYVTLILDAKQQARAVDISR